MRILQLIYESFGSPFGFGGAGVRAYEIYKRLKDRHDITLLCMKYPGARDDIIDGIRHIFVGTESRSLTKSVIEYTIKSANFVKKHGDNFDIIVENFLPSTPFFTRFLTKTPVVLQVQGIIEKHSIKKFNPFYSIPMYVVERFYPSFYKDFIFVSDVTKNKVISRIKKRINSYVIPNGIDEKFLQVVPEEEEYILFFSRIDIYTKGIDLLIEAFERLYNEYKDLRLVLAGYEFDSFKKVLSYCNPLVRNKIEYVGFLSGEKKLKLLSKAKIFILPSRHESLPISIIEAAACCKPVIVSDIDELRFVIDNDFGISFKAGSVESLVYAMRQLLDNAERRKNLGFNGREFAKNYLWDKIAIMFENVLNYIKNERIKILL